MKKKVNYTREFKVQACELVLKDGVKVKTVADKMCISNVMLYRWIDEYRTYGDAAFVGKGHLKPEEAKLKKLQKENEELRQQVEILKKAAAYFAKENRDGQILLKKSCLNMTPTQYAKYCRCQKADITVIRYKAIAK